jgi:hypothetical protein
MRLSLLLIITTALEILASVEGLPVEGRLPLLKWREAMELARNKTGLPGMSVAVLHKGKLIFAEGFGKRNRNDPVTAEVWACILYSNMYILTRGCFSSEILTKQNTLLKLSTDSYAHCIHD